MKFYPRSNLYKASNVTFNPETCEAYSYGWWRFIQRINGQIVFNWYSYSNSTRKHQGKVMGLLRELGVAIDLEIEAPKGLQDLQSAIDLYDRHIAELQAAIAKPKTWATKNVQRQEQIINYQQKMRLVRSLIKQQQNQAA